MSNNVGDGGPRSEEDDLRDIYGADLGREPPPVLVPKKDAFLPWHHPVKQVVRDHQWAALTKRLVEERTPARQDLRYFTLPGSDLLDVRVLAEVCGPLGVRIDYFGFDASRDEAGGEQAVASWVTAESSLRQADRISDRAIILPDRLEDIALGDSQASSQLRLREPFDVVNIDACDNLSFKPEGRDKCTFDALKTILNHQVGCRSPWLLFITTRVDPDLLGSPGLEFHKAVNDNLALSPAEFGAALANAIGAQLHLLATALPQVWTSRDARFLKLYSIALGKFLLQFFHGQPNLPARVELASAYAYRVHGEHPDMLALAFRITPEGMRVFPGNTGGAVAIPQLEAQRAVYVAQRAERLQDLDAEIEKDRSLLEGAVKGTITLLRAANYDIPAWGRWLADHPQRPLKIEAANLAE